MNLAARLGQIYQRRYLFAGEPPRPPASRVTRVGQRDARTGLWQVIHPDGSITLNGIPAFNRGLEPGAIVNGVPNGDGFIVLRAETFVPPVEEITVAPNGTVVLFFMVAEARYVVPPLESNVSSNVIVDMVRIYARVNTNPAILLAEITVPMLNSLMAIALPNSEVAEGATGEDINPLPLLPSIRPSLQICTALSSTEFLVNLVFDRQPIGQPATIASSAVYTALTTALGVQSQWIAPVGPPIPGDPVGDVPWPAPLSPYATALPTRQIDRNGFNLISAQGYEVALTFWKQNLDAALALTLVDPNNDAFSWSTVDSTTSAFLPIGELIEGVLAPTETEGQPGISVNVALPFSALAEMGIRGAHIWGLTSEQTQAGMLTTSVPVLDVFTNPAAYRVFKQGSNIVDGLINATQSLIFSDIPYPGGNEFAAFSYAPWQIVSCPFVKVVP